MTLHRTCCCGRCAFLVSCYTAGTAVPDVIQFSETNGDPTARAFLTPPDGITIDTDSITVTLNSVDVYRAPTNDRTITEWNITVEIDYAADTDYPGGFETDCRCDDGGVYSDIPPWTGVATFTGNMVYICTDDDTISSGTFNWEDQTAPRYNLNDDIVGCSSGTLDPPDPAITMDLKLTNGSSNWDPGATGCADLTTKYYDAVFNFELQQNGGCATTTYGTAATLTIRFGWS